jgi:hypothetical protein
VQDLNLHVIHLVDTSFGAAHIFGEGVVDDVGGAIAVVDEQREIRRLAEVGDAAGLLDGSTGKFGLHELDIGAVVGGLLGGVGGGEVARGGAIFGIGDGRLVARFNGGADGGARLAVAAVAVVGILGAGRLRLLALGGGNAALDGEGGAVCAGNAEGGGVAADLGRGYCCAGGAAWGVLRLLTLREWQAASCQHLGFKKVVVVVVMVVVVVESDGEWGRGAEAWWAHS